MKKSTTVVAALVLAAASLGAPVARAAVIITPDQALKLSGFAAAFGDSFGVNNAGNTFSEHFTFSVAGVPVDLDAVVASISRTAQLGLDITGLGLYSAAGAQLKLGKAQSSGAIDAWTLSSDNLALGDYYLQVSGSVVSNSSGSFGGAVVLAPVPEPGAYAMMFAGLGVVGCAALRRRRPT